MITTILPYKKGSVSARTLSQETRTPRTRLEPFALNSLRPRLVFNWGSSGGDIPDISPNHTVINSTEAVNRASCKLLTMQALAGASVSIPEFTTDISTARQWAEEQRTKVVCRTVLRGNSGRGIIISSTPEEVQPARLYTKYIPKQQEYRVHVAKINGTPYIFDVQAKRRRRSTPDSEVNWEVRNLAGGFVFAREGATPCPSQVITEATDALLALGLDFGAIDVVWNEVRQRAYVLEVNTAPGLEGTTLEKYSLLLDYWKQWARDQRHENLVNHPFFTITFSPYSLPWGAQTISAPAPTAEPVEPSEETVVQQEQPREGAVQERPELFTPQYLNEPVQEEFDLHAVSHYEPETDPAVCVYGVFFGETLVADGGVFATQDRARQELESSPLLCNLSRNGSLSVRPLEVRV